MMKTGGRLANSMVLMSCIPTEPQLKGRPCRIILVYYRYGWRGLRNERKWKCLHEDYPVLSLFSWNPWLLCLMVVAFTLATIIKKKNGNIYRETIACLFFFVLCSLVRNLLTFFYGKSCFELFYLSFRVVLVLWQILSAFGFSINLISPLLGLFQEGSGKTYSNLDGTLWPLGTGAVSVFFCSCPVPHLHWKKKKKK